MTAVVLHGRAGRSSRNAEPVEVVGVIQAGCNREEVPKAVEPLPGRELGREIRRRHFGGNRKPAEGLYGER